MSNLPECWKHKHLNLDLNFDYQICLNLINKSQCACVCGSVSAVEIPTTAPISLKSGMGILLKGRKVFSKVLTTYLDPRDQGA